MNLFTTYLITLPQKKMIYSIQYITISLLLILRGCWAAPCPASYSKCRCYKTSGGTILRIECSQLGNISRLPSLNHTTQTSRLIIQGKVLKNGSATTIWSQLPAHAFKDFRVSSLLVPCGVLCHILILGMSTHMFPSCVSVLEKYALLHVIDQFKLKTSSKLCPLH